MTYWLMNLWFLLGAGVVIIAAMMFPWRPRWQAVAGALGIVLVLTAVFDNMIIGFGIVDYDPAKISGLRIGVAPIEDFAYTLAAALIIPALWQWLGRKTPPQ